MISMQSLPQRHCVADLMTAQLLPTAKPVGRASRIDTAESIRFAKDTDARGRTHFFGMLGSGT